MIRVKDIKVVIGKLGKSHVYDTLSRNSLIKIDDSWLEVIKNYGRLKCKTSKIEILTQDQVVNLEKKFHKVEIYQNGKLVTICESKESETMSVDWLKNARIIAFDEEADMVVLYRYYGESSLN